MHESSRRREMQERARTGYGRCAAAGAGEGLREHRTVEDTSKGARAGSCLNTSMGETKHETGFPEGGGAWLAPLQEHPPLLDLMTPCPEGCRDEITAQPLPAMN